MGNLLGRFYCLHVAKRQMYPVTAYLPINCICIKLLIFMLLGDSILLVIIY